MDSGRLHDDLEPWWLPPADHEAVGEGSVRPTGRHHPKPSGTGTELLAAAMFGLADALGYERPRREDTVQVADAPIGNDQIPLDFGRLEPLE